MSWKEINLGLQGLKSVNFTWNLHIKARYLSVFLEE